MALHSSSDPVIQWNNEEMDDDAYDAFIRTLRANDERDLSKCPVCKVGNTIPEIQMCRHCEYTEQLGVPCPVSAHCARCDRFPRRRGNGCCPVGSTLQGSAGNRWRYDRLCR